MQTSEPGQSHQLVDLVEVDEPRDVLEPSVPSSYRSQILKFLIALTSTG